MIVITKPSGECLIYPEGCRVRIYSSEWEIVDRNGFKVGEVSFKGSGSGQAGWSWKFIETKTSIVDALCFLVDNLEEIPKAAHLNTFELSQLKAKLKDFNATKKEWIKE